MPILVIAPGAPELGHYEYLSSDCGNSQADTARSLLMTEYRLDPSQASTASSALRRARETARAMGFRDINSVELLDEIAHTLHPDILQQNLEDRELPPNFTDTANTIIKNPPIERVWIADTLVIASLCQVLDIYHDRPLLPNPCEIRELPIESRDV